MSDEHLSAYSKITKLIKIKTSDVPKDLAEKAIVVANEAIDKFQIEKDMATYMKKKCDEHLGGTWHAVVGRNFGCSITHDTKHVMFFQLDLINVLLFKSLE